MVSHVILLHLEGLPSSFMTGILGYTHCWKQICLHLLVHCILQQVTIQLILSAGGNTNETHVPSVSKVCTIC